MKTRNLMRIQERLQTIREKIGDRPVTIVAVSKYATNERMIEAYQAGIRDFGENKVQDALKKMSELPVEITQNIHWHFIGHLQTNKVKQTVGRFSLIHSVDSVRLAREISERNHAAGRIQDILLQVNASDDPDRFGFAPQELQNRLPDLISLRGIRLRGLMAMAPHTENVTVLKSAFSGLKSLRDALESACGISLPELSMGMSHDYVHALESGATMIRIGNYLFQNES